MAPSPRDNYLAGTEITARAAPSHCVNIESETFVSQLCSL